jgi:carboxyvinyl-carboxyphosphonate phosphorylmutase
MTQGTALRRLFQKGELIVAPGAHDALTAKVVAQTGFPALYMTGYGQSASTLGYPDVGLMTMSEMVSRAAAIAEACNIPVVADADTGFGNAVNVKRTVREYERAGVAAIQLEDQVMPKKCGHMTGRQVISTGEMVGKIKAATDARIDNDLMIMARTDARTVHGIGEAIRRGKAYEEAGADILFIESPETEEEMRLIASSFNIPTLANMVEGGRTPQLSNNELARIGYKIVIYPTASVYTMAKAMLDLMESLKKTGTTRNMYDHMMTFEDFNELIGLPEIRKAENKYLPKLD